MCFVLQVKITYYLISIGHVFFKSVKSLISYRMNQQRQHLIFKEYAKESGFLDACIIFAKNVVED